MSIILRRYNRVGPNSITPCHKKCLICRGLTIVQREQANRIFSYLRRRQDEMVSLLSQSASIETPSTEPSTQAAVFQLFAERLASLGFHCRRIKGRNSGGQILAFPSERLRGSDLQLLLGHVDTVWPLGTKATMPVESRDGCLHGPGVFDMKGGLVQAVFALQSLHELGMQPPVMPIFFMNSDEEIGSKDSVVQIRRLARIVDRAMVMEPSLGPAGHLKTSRKGVGHFTITVRGRAAHAGLNPEQGISAILELSHVVQTLFKLNDPDRGVSVNVGIIDGGTRPNVVASQSRAEVDVRVRTNEDAAMIEKAIHSLQPVIPGTELQIQGRIARPPMESTPRNRRLWHRAQEAADALQIELDEAAAGGGSDGNWTSLDTATLDGLGAVGDGAHALTEHIIEDKMPERAALLACLILSPPVR